MREACHHTLYSLVNSVAMNGMDEDTTVKYTHISLEIFTMLIAWISIILFVVSLGLSIYKGVKFNKTYKYEKH